MTTHSLGVILNGVTGRMGANQHLARSILAIREQGGVPLETGERIVPEPLLVGRDAGKLRALAERHGLEHWTTDLAGALRDPDYPIYFDAVTTQQRVPNSLAAVAAGKHIYIEKPVATTTPEALELQRAATAAGVKSGVVQDKLWLPGLLKLRALLEAGFFGELLSVRGEFGYWVFDGVRQPCQRPSWNYRAEDGGGIILDMFCHWRYLIDNLFGPVQALVARGAIHVGERVDESGQRYRCTADDAAYAIFELVGGVPVQFNSSWCTRVRRDDLLTVHVDGTAGSAMAGLRRCWIQPDATTPRPVWNPDVEPLIDYRGGWQEVAEGREYDNAFKTQWELFLRHVVADTPFPWTLLEGAKGVQLAELGMRSWKERCWVDIPALTTEE